jgi:hypothetical protein
MGVRFVIPLNTSIFDFEADNLTPQQRQVIEDVADAAIQAKEAGTKLPTFNIPPGMTSENALQEVTKAIKRKLGERDKVSLFWPS